MNAADRPGRAPPTLVFAHGWGFDAGFWDALRIRLRAWPQRVLERGYFSGPVADDALPEGPLVVIGHSFGCMRLLARLAPSRRRPCAWIGINAFARFSAGDDFRHGAAPRLLQRMADRLEAAPAAVVDEFRRRCGAAPAGAAPHPRVLAGDLRALRELDLRAHVRGLAAPLLVLAGTADPVVPAPMAADAFPGRAIGWMPGGGHLLPLQAPDWCAARIAGFLAHHGLASASASASASAPAPAPASASAAREGTWAGRPAGGEGGEAPCVRPGGVAARFGAAAAHYDRHAGVQREVAARLAARIARLDLPARPRILEIGCGTGLLTGMVDAHFPEADWTITDLSPAMLAQARSRLRPGRASRYQVMDGEHPALADGPGRFDLICSSMALQWFGDPARGLARLAALLAPAGHLAVALPTRGTFAEWRRAHEVLGLRPAMMRFPAAGALRPRRPDVAARIDVERIVDECGSARAFLRGLKGIGATAPRPDGRPLPVPLLRRVCAEFDRAGARCSYRIAFSLWRRDEAGAHGEASP